MCKYFYLAFSCSHYDFVPLILYSTYVSPNLALEKKGILDKPQNP